MCCIPENKTENPECLKLWKGLIICAGATQGNTIKSLKSLQGNIEVCFCYYGGLTANSTNSPSPLPLSLTIADEEGSSSHGAMGATSPAFVTGLVLAVAACLVPSSPRILLPPHIQAQNGSLEDDRPNVGQL